jgi:hypothetical protein
VAVTFFGGIRPEFRFESVDELIAEMNKDRDAARRILADTATASRLDIALATVE